MLLVFALALAAQQPPSDSPRLLELPAFPDGQNHIGSYTPNAQLLAWCSGNTQADVSSCIGYIIGVIDASGMIDADFPQGPIDTSGKAPERIMIEIRDRVVVYLNALPNTRMTNPASRTVYEALVSKYPYFGKHRKDLPLRPKINSAEPGQPKK